MRRTSIRLIEKNVDILCVLVNVVISINNWNCYYVFNVINDMFDINCICYEITYFRLIVWLDFKVSWMDRADTVQYTVLLNQCSSQCYRIHQPARTYVSYNRSPQRVGKALVTLFNNSSFVMHICVISGKECSASPKTHQFVNELRIKCG